MFVRPQRPAPLVSQDISGFSAILVMQRTATCSNQAIAFSLAQVFQIAIFVRPKQLARLVQPVILVQLVLLVRPTMR